MKLCLLAGIIRIIQKQYIFQQMISKRQQKRIQEKIIEEQSVGDCSCQMLDTSLSDVGDSDCSCSECLEANLQAFNELKQLEQHLQRENSTQNFRANSTKRNENQRTRQGTRVRDQSNKQTKKRLNDYKSLDRKHHHKEAQRKENEKGQIEQGGEGLPNKFTSQCINEYVLVAKYRARQYLHERKKLEKNQIEERLRLKQLIKQNLMALKYTALAIRQQQAKDNWKQNHKWNHTPYHCKSKVQCRKLATYDPDLENKKEEIQQIKARIKKYKEQTKEKPYQCPDKCPKHHLRTSKTKLVQIEKYIKEKAMKIEDKRKKQKAEKAKKEKIKQAKLRAIDLKCKDILAKTKRHDPNASRTSFHNSIDHFSTFSQLKQYNLQNDMQKEKKRKIRQEQKQGGRLQQQIYQNLSDELIGDHPPIHSKIGTQSRYRKKQNQEDQWCEKIVREAKIKPPKETKKEDNQKKEKKANKEGDREKERPLTTKPKGQSQKHLKQEEQKRKQLQKQIQRKKQQIYKQFQKRNSSTANNEKLESKNKAIRKQYEESLKGQKANSKNTNFKVDKRIEQGYDPYRQVYNNQPSKNVKHLEAIGDPLMQQFQYQRNLGKYKELRVGQDNQIFTKNANNLKNKRTLNV